MCQRWLYRMVRVEDSEASDEECILRQQVERSGVALRRRRRAMPRTPFSDESKLKKFSGKIILLTRIDSEQDKKPVSPPGDSSIATEHSRKELDCDTSQDFSIDSSPVHGPPSFIKDTAQDKQHPNRSALTVPPGLRIGPSGIPNAGLGVWNEVYDLPVGVWFGPLEVQLTQDEDDSRSGYAAMIARGSHCYESMDGEEKSCSNWMRYVKCARNDKEQNLVVFQYHGLIFYRICQVVRPGYELLVWYRDEYARQLGIKGLAQPNPEMHSCSACPLAFSRKKWLCHHVKGSHPSAISSGTFARKHLLSVEPCPEDHSQQQQDADTQRPNDKHEGQEVKTGGRSFFKRIRQRGHSGALLTTLTAPKRSSSEGGRILQKKTNAVQKVHQEESEIGFVGGGVPRSVALKHGGCGQGFKSGSELKRHQNTHSRGRAYTCSEGGPSFTEVTDVITLQETQSREETSVCKDCVMSYKETSDLVGHNWTHSEEKPYLCQECGQHFTVKADLNTHKRTHKGVKLYICMRCRRCFSSKSGLTLHHKTHAGEKPYACRDCGQGFAQKSKLMRHQKKHSAK